MSLLIDIPSKTFLAGEYNILSGGDALLISTKPYFKFILHKSEKKQTLDPLPFHRNSPGGRFLLDNKNIFNGYDIHFHDQHNNCGGFGASGAQFLGSFLAKIFLINGEISIPDISSTNLLQTFWKYSSGQTKPSGGDIMSQLHGNITLLNSKNISVETMHWQFAELGFCLLPTYNKLPTHQHLEDLDLKYDQELDQAVRNIYMTFSNSDSDNFVKYLNLFNKLLLSRNLVTPNTMRILELTKQCPEILAQKGCGALGADVILLVFKKENRTAISRFVSKHNMSILACDTDTVTGAQIDYHYNLDLFRDSHEMVC